MRKTVNTISKVINPGKVPCGYATNKPLFCKVEVSTDGRLSIIGVIGPRSGGDAWGGCGQVEKEFAHREPAQNDKRTHNPIKPEDIEFSEGWTADMWLDFLDNWHRWHLNDMRAGCEHQTGPEWDTSKELSLAPLTWGDKYHDMRRAAEDGKMTSEEYATWPQTVALVDRLTGINHSPKHPDLWGNEGESAINAGLVKMDTGTRAEKVKTAGWVYPSEHPEGILCKPCPVCGYKYGSEWKREELPASVIEFMRSLPDSTITPAWV